MPLPSGLPERVADEEPLARFLTSSGHFNATGVRHAAFLPNPRDGKTSVFRHGAEPRENLELIGNAEVAQGRTLHGAGIIAASEVRATQLDVEAIEPPDRHADITGWPWLEGDREFAKAGRKEIALVLAQKARLIRFA
jgi:hypothetical protein